MFDPQSLRIIRVCIYQAQRELPEDKKHTFDGLLHAVDEEIRIADAPKIKVKEVGTMTHIHRYAARA